MFFDIYKINESIEETYYQKNNEVRLNRAKYYYENDKERLREEARDKCRNLSKKKMNSENMKELTIIKCLKK